MKGDDEDDVLSEQAIGFVQAVLLPGVACVSSRIRKSIGHSRVILEAALIEKKEKKQSNKNRKFEFVYKSGLIEHGQYMIL